MIQVVTSPRITPVDRLGLTLCLAIITHGIIILGVTFSPEEKSRPKYETMEIILVQEQSEPVKEAQFLAQANLEGGGESEERVSPSTPMPAPFPEQKPELTMSPAVETPPPAEASSAVPKTTEEDMEPAPVKNEKKLVAHKDDARVAATETVKEEREKAQSAAERISRETDADTQEQALQQIQALPDAATLLANSFKIASLNAEVRRKLEAQSQRPRRKFISASTKEYKYAAYMEAWRVKVERVGNLNYPDEARKNRLTGSLILDVALNMDGSVNQITVRRSSGSKILDDAAVRIVELSSPFAPFPEQIRSETDILHITRTWQFLNNITFR
ncbi:MAG: TonB family protein [Gammaproteobacteria bacterium]